jgi:hypothetical protein
MERAEKAKKSSRQLDIRASILRKFWRNRVRKQDDAIIAQFVRRGLT